MGNIHACAYIFRTRPFFWAMAVFIGVYWVYIGVYSFCVHCLAMDLAVKALCFFNTLYKNTVYWTLAKSLLTSVYFTLAVEPTQGRPHNPRGTRRQPRILQTLCSGQVEKALGSTYLPPPRPL